MATLPQLPLMVSSLREGRALLVALKGGRALLVAAVLHWLLSAPILPGFESAQ